MALIVVPPRQPVAPSPPLPAISRDIGGRRLLFLEDCRHPVLGMWNDGAGSAHRDCEIPFAGLPSIRLNPQGSTTGNSEPGTSPLTTGVVMKRRIHDDYSGKFGVECWFRWTSANNTSNILTSMSLYNRTRADGGHFYMSRLWFDPGGNNSEPWVKVLKADASYELIATVTNQDGTGSHLYDPTTGQIDKAGGWHYAKLVTDLENKEYVRCQFDDKIVDLTGVPIYIGNSAGFAGMHFSFEYSQRTSTRRFMNIAQFCGTVED